MSPKMLDKGVREKSFAESEIIFPENLHEKVSSFAEVVWEYFPVRLWEENCKHFEDILGVE